MSLFPSQWFTSVLCALDPLTLGNVPTQMCVQEMRGNTCAGSACHPPPLRCPSPAGDSNGKLITSAANTIILQFISRVAAADERAIGVDTALHTGVLCGALIHICTKPKHTVGHQPGMIQTLLPPQDRPRRAPTSTTQDTWGE